MKVTNRPDLEKRGSVVVNVDRAAKKQYIANKKRAKTIQKLEKDVEYLKELVMNQGYSNK